MKTVYKYKGIEINLENYQTYIPKQILYIIIRGVFYIGVLIFGSLLFKIIVGILMFYDILSFVALFLIYYVLHNSKNSTGVNINTIFNVASSAKLMGVDLKKDDINTIKKKYRELSKKHHPDFYINDTMENQEIAKRNFQKLNTAYNILIEYKNNEK